MKLINPEIRFEVTNKCNAACIMCPREKMKRPQGVLCMDLYKRVLDEAVEAGARFVSLENFGESFLDPLIFERARYARQKGCQVFTITNGSLFTEEMVRDIVSCFDKIRISMYGVTSETYEKIHRGLSFDKVRGNVDKLLKEKEKANSSIKIELYFLLLKENEHEMKEFVAQYEHRADALSVWKPHNWGDGRGFRTPMDVKKVSCGRPATGPVQVQWDGYLVPCCFDYDSRIVIGDLNNNTLHEALHGLEYEKLRRAHAQGDFSPFPFCNACDQLTKRNDVLIYTTIRDSVVGATNTTYFGLKEEGVESEGRSSLQSDKCCT